MILGDTQIFGIISYYELIILSSAQSQGQILGYDGRYTPGASVPTAILSSVFSYTL